MPGLDLELLIWEIRGHGIPYGSLLIFHLDGTLSATNTSKSADGAIMLPFKFLIDEAPMSILIVDSGAKIIYANNKATEFLGFTRTELKGKLIEILVPPRFRENHVHFRESFFQNPQVRLMGKGRELWVLTKGGREVQVEIGLNPLGIGDRQIVVVHLIDITEKRLHQDLLERNDKLESIGFLAAGVAHDFNNILGGIHAVIDLIDLLSKDNPTILQYLATIKALVKRGSGLTGEMMTFSKGGIPIRKSIDLVTLIKKAAALSITGTKTSLLIIDDGTQKLVQGDETQLEQVITNLVINATQASTDGCSVEISIGDADLTYFSASGLAQTPHYKITVTDDGPGIPEANINKIFDPFFTTKKDGHGLGLSVVQSIISHHLGQVFVESIPAKGTTFTILLPKDRDNSRTITDQSENEIKKLKSGKGKILVLDDESIIRNSIGQLLEVQGYTVTKVETGEKALVELISAKDSGSKFDVAVMDITVPGFQGGIDVGRKLAQLGDRTPIILISGYSVDMDSITDGTIFKGFLKKPFSADQLCNAIALVLSSDNTE